MHNDARVILGYNLRIHFFLTQDNRIVVDVFAQGVRTLFSSVFSSEKCLFIRNYIGGFTGWTDIGDIDTPREHPGLRNHTHSRHSAPQKAANIECATTPIFRQPPQTPYRVLLTSKNRVVLLDMHTQVRVSTLTSGGLNLIVTDLELLAATFCLSPLTTTNAGLSQVKVKSIAPAKTLRKRISLLSPGAMVKGPFFRVKVWRQVGKTKQEVVSDPVARWHFSVRRCRLSFHHVTPNASECRRNV